MNSKNRRLFKRYAKLSDFDLSYGDKHFKAKMLDYSLSGVGAIVEEASNLGKGKVVDLYVKEPSIKTLGEVAWAKSKKSGLRIGIKNIGELKGLIKDFRLADSFIGLQRRQTTGILHVESGDMVKKVYVKNGDMIFSASNQQEDRLGSLLFRDGKINIEQYNHTVAEMKKTKQRQGAILVKLGYIRPQELVALIRQQVEQIILSLFTIEDGSFIFKEVLLPAEEIITLKLSAGNLIYYGIKQITNFRRIASELPSLDSALCFSADPFDVFQDIRLDDSGRKISSFVDGKTSIKQIISISQLSNLEALKTIFALLNTRMISDIKAECKPGTDTPKEVDEEMIKEKVEAKVTIPLADEIEEMHRRYEGLGYYGVLGVENHAAIHEIKSAYYKAAKRYHPDMHFYLADDTLKGKLNDIFTYVYEAYTTLSNPRTRKEYDELLTVKPARLMSRSDKARAFFEEGKLRLRANNYTEAEQLLGQAVYFDNTMPEYQYHYGLVLMRQNKFRQAEEAISSSVRLDPNNADYLAELGFIYLELNFPVRARAFFRKALNISRGHVRASEGMTKIK